MNGTGHDTSDLDIVLRHSTDVSQDVPGWDELRQALQDSALPILVNLHLWSRLPATFRANIETDYVVLPTGNDEEN